MTKIKKIMGIDVILNKIENDKSFTLAINFLTGSKDERSNEKGISHLLEHMLFTGTNTRNSYEITESLDFYGANYNAYTSKDKTVYYFNSLTSKQKETTEIFFDMVTDPIFPEDQLKKEKQVIFEEIKMDKDDVRTTVYQIVQSNLIEGNFKYNIIGSEESVDSITREMLIDYYHRRYTKDNLCISISGNFDEDLLTKTIENYFSRLPELAIVDDFEYNKLLEKEIFIKKEINQVNIYMFKKSDVKNNIKDSYIDYILEAIVGEGFSSRLFQEIREKRGLAYSVYDFSLEVDNFRTFGIYIGTSKNKYEEAIKATKEVLEDVGINGVTEREVEKIKNYILSSRAVAKENYKLAARYFSIYKKYGEIYDENYIEDIIRDITLEEVNTRAKKLVGNYSICVVGDIDV